MLIELLDINLEWRMHKVSDGQRRRVQICMGLLHPYKVSLHCWPYDGDIRICVFDMVSYVCCLIWIPILISDDCQTLMDFSATLLFLTSPSYLVSLYSYVIHYLVATLYVYNWVFWDGGWGLTMNQFVIKSTNLGHTMTCLLIVLFIRRFANKGGDSGTFARWSHCWSRCCG